MGFFLFLSFLFCFFFFDPIYSQHSVFLKVKLAEDSRLVRQPD